jgi:predicted kinase
MPKIIMLAGASGSGKSTLRNRILSGVHDDLPKLGTMPMIISRDDIIEAWALEDGDSYEVTWLCRGDEAEDRTFELLDKAVAADRDVIWDQTNLNRRLRAERLEKFPADYEKICIGLEFPIYVLLQRIEERRLATGKGIPKFVPVNHLDMYERPSTDEGFSEVYVIDTLDMAVRRVEGLSLDMPDI